MHDNQDTKKHEAATDSGMGEFERDPFEGYEKEPTMTLAWPDRDDNQNTDINDTEASDSLGSEEAENNQQDNDNNNADFIKLALSDDQDAPQKPPKVSPVFHSVPDVDNATEEDLAGDITATQAQPKKRALFGSAERRVRVGLTKLTSRQ